MVKMPSTQAPLAVPNATRGIASLNIDPILQANREGAKAIKGGFDAIAGGLGDVEKALYIRQQQDEERELKQLDVEFSKQRRIISTNFRKTQGQNTLDSRPGLDKQYADAKEAILKTSKSAKVRQAFNLLADGKTQVDLEEHDNYTEDQRRQANEDASKAVMSEAYQSVAESPLDEPTAVLAEKQIESEVAAQAEINGWSDDVAKTKYEAAISQLFKVRVASSAQDHPGEAWKIYEQNKDRIDGDVRIEIEKDLEETTLATMAQGYAEQAIAKYPGNITKQREYIRETLDGKKEEAALTELQGRLEEYRSEVRWNEWIKDQAYQRVARQDALDTKHEKDMVDEAQDSLNKWLHDGKGNISDWENENPELGNWLLKDVYKSEQMERVEKRVLEDRQYAKVSDPATIQKYSVPVQDLAKVTETELDVARASLSQTDWKKLEGRVRGAKASMDAAMGATSKLYDEANSLILENVPRKGNKATGKIALTDDQLESVKADMSAYIYRSVESGVIPKREELNREAQRLLIKIESDPSMKLDWFSSEEEASWEGIVSESRSMSPAQKAAATVDIDDIPVALKDLINSNLALFNIEGNDTLRGKLAAAYALNDQERWAQLLGFKNSTEYNKFLLNITQR